MILVLTDRQQYVLLPILETRKKPQEKRDESLTDMEMSNVIARKQQTTATKTKTSSNPQVNFRYAFVFFSTSFSTFIFAIK